MRMNRIQQLRAEHQKRHNERSSKYFSEENHESDLRQVCISFSCSFFRLI